MALIIVNDIAADSGGALSILDQFEDAIRQEEKNNYYYIFVSKRETKKAKNFEEVKSIYNKSWINRIKWDLFGLKKWLRNYNVKPDLIISLQNIALIGYKDTPQILYLHQSLPFYKNKFSIFRKDERILWFYKNIYRLFIYFSIILTKCTVYVQTNWMKVALENTMKNRIDIRVIRPNVEVESERTYDECVIVEEILNENKFNIFYPTSNFKYKNANTAINCIKYINQIDKKYKSNIQLIITIKNDNKISNYFDDNIKFIGYQPKNIIYELYKKSDLMIFPSYIETFGLPLIEAASVGLPIIVPDLPYSREILKEYQGAIYVKDYLNPEEWSEKILKQYNVGKIRYKPIEWKNDGWKELLNDISEILNLK